MSVLIQTKNLEKVYHRGGEAVHALRGVELEFHKGEFATIVGPSGSGKTTLLHILGCLDRPSGGTVEIDGISLSDISGSGQDRIRREMIGFVFQEFHLIPSLSVADNILLPLLFSRKEPDPGYLDHLMETVGIVHRKDHRPNQLSGGEMQRAAVARALINRPQVLLADEPSGNLDTDNSIRIFKLLDSLKQEGITVIVVTHNMELAQMADRQVHFRDGRLADDPVRC